LVVFFDTPTPLDVISTLLPDVLIKGNDYLAENIIGADVVLKNGGKVDTITLVQGYSTSNVVNKIKSFS
jgi:D-glycero-beta-D-manno-heptose 1-phosphate adenylyltransferase